MQRHRSGFLLIECLLAFALLSCVLVICASGFYTTVREYTASRKRLKYICLARAQAELFWSAQMNHDINNELKVTLGPVEGGIMLPVNPDLKQEWIEAGDHAKKDLRMLRLRGAIKEG